jgi:hypothetical protein
MSLAMKHGLMMIVAVAAVIGLGLSGCSKGQSLRGTTSLAVKAALADNHVDYKGSITCTGSSLPINCTGTTTTGQPIAGNLSTNSGNSCVLAVNVAAKQIARESAKCK